MEFILKNEDIDKANKIIENALSDHKNKNNDSDEEKHYSVYIHTNKINNKKYIGQTGMVPTSYRWGKNGRKYTEKRRGKIPNGYFPNAINKYGWDGFYHDVLRTGLTKEEADILEIALIAGFDTMNRDYGYNRSTGGHRGSPSQETKEKLREINIGRHVSDETRKNLSISHMGLKRTQESIEKGRRKIRKARGVPVLQYDRNGILIKRWDYKIDAANALDIKDSSISDCCAGRAKTAGGFIWRNIDEPLTKEHLEWCNTNGRTKKRRIIRYTKNGNYIDIWNNGEEIKRVLGIRHALSCAHGNRDSAGGYIFKFEDEVKD